MGPLSQGCAIHLAAELLIFLRARSFREFLPMVFEHISSLKATKYIQTHLKSSEIIYISSSSLFCLPPTCERGSQRQSVHAWMVNAPSLLSLAACALHLLPELLLDFASGISRSGLITRCYEQTI